MHTPIRARRGGFTLVEMLVVIAIIGTIMGLLLPAVQSARESGRRAACSNNLRQIGLAMNLHVDQRGFFPSGGWGWCWTGDPDRGFGRSQPGSWGYSILPSLDQQNTFDLGSDGDADNVTSTQRTGSARALAMPIGLFYCPTRRSATVYPVDVYERYGMSLRNSTNPGEGNRSDYAANGGSTPLGWGDGPPDMPTALGGGGFVNLGGCNGIAYQRSEVKPAMISDGLSKTYLVGEKYLNPNDYLTGVDIRDDHSMFAGDDLDMHAWTDQPPAQDTGGFISYTTFGSAHPAGVIMAWADGSVRTVSFYVDAGVHRLSGSRNDEQINQSP